MSPLALLAMLCAAFAAGAINSIAGGGTLLTFPVLIALGLDPKVANEQFNHSVSTRHNQRYRWSCWRVVVNFHAFTNLCANGSVVDFVCNDPFHESGRN